MKYIVFVVPILFFVGCGSDAPQGEAGRQSPPIVHEESQSIDLAALEAEYLDMKAAYQLDGSMREEYVDAAVAFGTATMHGPGAPQEKYPMALKLYGEALEIDPGNEEAERNRQLILEIYESLGRTPPE